MNETGRPKAAHGARQLIDHHNAFGPVAEAPHTGYCAHGVTRGARCRHCLNDGERTAQTHTVRPPAHSGRLAGFVPGTSMIARQIGASEMSAVKTAIMDILAASAGLTDDEIHARYAAAGHPLKSRQRIATARGELAKAGFVTETGERRLSAMGHPARVWRVTTP